MPELSLVLAIALLPVLGNLVGSLLAESLRTPRWLIGAALHAAAGIAIGVVSIQLMPRILGSTPTVLLFGGFVAGALLSLGLSRAIRSPVPGARGTAGAWMVWMAVCADLIGDGVMTGVGSTVTSGLGFLIALSQSVANIPGGFAATANLRDDGVERRWRIATAGLLVLPVLASAGLGFWLLQDSAPSVQNAALAVIVGVLLVTTVEDIVPEGDAPQPKRWISTMSFAAGFVLVGLVSTYV
jgi:zinc transporter, ZIP family